MNWTAFIIGFFVCFFNYYIGYRHGMKRAAKMWSDGMKGVVK